jgi:hypothetical protein
LSVEEGEEKRRAPTTPGNVEDGFFMALERLAPRVEAQISGPNAQTSRSRRGSMRS